MARNVGLAMAPILFVCEVVKRRCVVCTIVVFCGLVLVVSRRCLAPPAGAVSRNIVGPKWGVRCVGFVRGVRRRSWKLWFGGCLVGKLPGGPAERGSLSGGRCLLGLPEIGNILQIGFPTYRTRVGKGSTVQYYVVVPVQLASTSTSTSST